MQAGAGQRTVVTAGKFDGDFTTAQGKNHLASLHGAPYARIVSSTPGQPDRVSTSDSVDAAFLPQGGIDSITQQGNFVYTDGQQPEKRMQAWGNSARYTPADQMLVLSGSPRVVDGAMATTATTIRINRATGEALAEDDVKSTYSQMKEQPDGALLASSSPIHVTASSMTAHSAGGVALYSGKARLWQDANVIEAPSIQFDRDQRSVTAQGSVCRAGADDPGAESEDCRQPDQESKHLLRQAKRRRKDRDRPPKSWDRARFRSLRRSSPTPIPSGEFTTKAESWPSRRTSQRRPRRSMPIFFLEAKPRRINRLRGRDSSTGWSPKVMLSSRNRTVAPKDRSWSTRRPTTSSS